MIRMKAITRSLSRLSGERLLLLAVLGDERDRRLIDRELDRRANAMRHHGRRSQAPAPSRPSVAA
jgi:hypothetical protein